LKNVYFDHNAPTPIRKEVREEILPYTCEYFGNPSSIHWAGRNVRKKIEWAREKVAGFCGCEPLEITFTSSGTESDNIAIKGVAFKNFEKKGHIVTSVVEHSAVLNTCRFLEKFGFEVTYLPVSEVGSVRLEDLKQSLRDDTILISIMYANNESGAVNPVKEISKIAEERGISFHCDAVQAIGKLPARVEDIGADIITFSAHKVNALKGTGGIYVRKGSKLEPLIHGGHQERGRRAGTENVVGIVAMGKSFELLTLDWEEEAMFIENLRDRFEKELLDKVEDIKVNGKAGIRLPNTSNISFSYVEGEALLVSLDMIGVAASTGSACTSGSLEPSYVLTAMGVDPVDAQGSLRFSFGYGNTEKEIEYAVAKIPEIVGRLRNLSPLYRASAT